MLSLIWYFLLLLELNSLLVEQIILLAESCGILFLFLRLN
jgi:hypothetical protein